MQCARAIPVACLGSGSSPTGLSAEYKWINNECTLITLPRCIALHASNIIQALWKSIAKNTRTTLNYNKCSNKAKTFKVDAAQYRHNFLTRRLGFLCYFGHPNEIWSYPVAQLVKALHCKLEGRGFFPSALCPCGWLSLQQKWVPGIFPGGKEGRCVGQTNLPPSCADCLEVWEPQPPVTLRACPGL
jgi:hypothetical protein